MFFFYLILDEQLGEWSQGTLESHHYCTEGYFMFFITLFVSTQLWFRGMASV